MPCASICMLRWRERQLSLFHRKMDYAAHAKRVWHAAVTLAPTGHAAVQRVLLGRTPTCVAHGPQLPFVPRATNDRSQSAWGIHNRFVIGLALSAGIPGLANTRRELWRDAGQAGVLCMTLRRPRDKYDIYVGGLFWTTKPAKFSPAPRGPDAKGRNPLIDEENIEHITS